MIFKEKQRFTQWWLWAIIASSNISIAYTLLNAYVRQVIWGEPWGNQPLSDTGLTILAIFMITIMSVVTWIFIISRLEVEINEDAVYYRFKPFIWNWKKIIKSEIHNYEVTTFNRLLDYGGLGYRQTFTNGIGLIIKGNSGLKLNYGKGNKKIMLSTQKPKELQKAMEQMMHSTKCTVDG